MAKRGNYKTPPAAKADRLEILKFPRTRHLLDAGGSGVTRDDLLMTSKEADQFLKGKVISIEEKIDGANLGISINKNYQIRAQNRSHFVSSSSHKQFSSLDNWIATNSDDLIKLLDGGRFILYGEWMFAKHSIHYTKLPSYFIAFDILDTETGNFVTRRLRDEMLEGTEIKTVQLIAERRFKTGKELLPFLETRSAYYDGPVEGIYLRVDQDTQENESQSETRRILLQRSKIVRPDFLQNIEEQWTRQKFTKNICEYY